MAFFISTGLAEGLCGTDSLLGLMDGGEIRFYSGTVPASADAAIGGATLLCTILKDGTDPLALVADGAMVRKPNGDTWEGAAVATGAASFYRHVQSADDGSASTSALRIQGTVGLTNAANMTLADVNFSSGISKPLPQYSVRMPTF